MKLGGLLRRSVVLGLLALGFMATIAFAVPATAGAATGGATEQACLAVGGTWDDGTCVSPDGSPDLNRVIESIVNILTVIVGIVAVIMIIWGGFKYITAAGDSSKISSAKSTIVYAVVGLVIVALAQVIVGFVIETIQGAGEGDAEEETSLIIRRPFA